MTVLEPHLAGPSDDAGIRRLLACNPVPGSVRVTYECEPSFFAATGLLGPFVQTMIGRDPDSGAVGVLACRSVRSRWIDGERADVGYLSHLRIDGPQRGRWFLSKGMRFLRGLDADGRCEGYVTTIIEGDADAVGVLVDSARPGFPRYREIGRLETLALVTRRRPLRSRGLRVVVGSPETMPAVVALHEQEGPRRQFGIAWSAADLAAGSPSTPGLRPEDFSLVYDDDRLVAAGAVWDQSGVKQTVVHEYGGLLRRARPIYSLGAALVGARALPAPGGRLSHAHAALVVVRDDDPVAYGALLADLLERARLSGIGFLMIGHTVGDPLLDAARRFTHITYRSRVYTVGWDDRLFDRLDGRPIGLEIACL